MTIERYSVPKRQISAEVLLPGRIPAVLRLFLNESAESHAGRERPSDILNGPHGFIPAIDSRERVVFLNSDAVMVVSVAAEHELDTAAPRAEDLAPDQATKASVEVILQDGTSLHGTINYLMPEAQRRLQDFLNGPERFVALREGGVAHLINKRSITKVLTLPG